jgi:hypothetical protein
MTFLYYLPPEDARTQEPVSRRPGPSPTACSALLQPHDRVNLGDVALISLVSPLVVPVANS